MTINLPALWFDDFAELTTSGLLSANTYPERDSVEADSVGAFEFDILCTNGNNVDLANTDVYVDGVQAYDGGTSSWINGFAGTATGLPGGPPLLADWQMELAGVASWVVFNGAVITKSTAAPILHGTQVLRVTQGAPGYAAAKQVATLTIGLQYHVTGYARSGGVLPPALTGFGPTFTGTNDTHWQRIDETFIATSADVFLFSYGDSVGDYTEWNNVLFRATEPDVRIAGQAPADWTSDQLVTIRVVSQDDNAPAPVDTLDESYSFTVEDLTEPQLVSAFATYATTIRATFDEGMLASSADGSTDALNPANYEITYVPETNRQAAVSVAVTAVTQISATVYDLTADIELTFWRNYLLTCGAIADSSSNANALDADFRTAGFAAWTPPEWPPTRRFKIWDMLAQANRNDDVTGDLERLVDCWQDVVWMLLWDADRMEEIWDVDRAPEIFLDARLQDLGNPHSFDLTELQKRKLLDVLVPSYRQHGTEPAIINLVRFFLGITVTVYAYNSFEYRWVLGQDELGQGTILGPGDGTADLYTFVIQSLTDLTTEDRRWIGLIADTTKPAHEHYLIQDPTDTITWDHWQLGFSVLGTETILH